MLRRIGVAVSVVFSAAGAANAWGATGHSVVTEIAQRRLNAETSKGVAELLGPGASLASIASWADDERVRDKTTIRWHFVSIPGTAIAYEASRDCVLDPALGDCLIAAIERQLAAVACSTQPLESRQRALKFLLHFVGDLHQPLHTIDGQGGGNGIVATLVTQEAVNGNLPYNSNLHSAWDARLIDKTTRSWGSSVERLESGWLETAVVSAVTAGTTIDWANESHLLSVAALKAVPSNIVLDDAYRRSNLPVLDGQLGRAGLRLGNLLNLAFATGQCTADQPN
ncbi:S1/P1 nuclease [Mesorhizobium sp. L-8-3]|uniref:S1/P1 nuclease n=1 Tax=Mesorhizobium sp. L-8-3 TaxID=2744522 RepID=UPI0019285409|nr:S1/P1 nuclease [Mesorhizobium sp. L-8-3]BCH26866.1 endonuclease [Mesorhizobium sp. L-8-3]